MAGDAAKAWDLMEKVQICMLVTRDGTSLRARPMGTYVRRHENAIYFLTDVRNHKDDEIESSREVCAAFADTSGNRYVSVSGRAEVYQDRAKVKELWSTPAKAWWETADDPNIRVLRVTPAFAEYWDSPEAVVSYVEMAVAAMTGNEPDVGENRKVTM